LFFLEYLISQFEIRGEKMSLSNSDKPKTNEFKPVKYSEVLDNLKRLSDEEKFEEVAELAIKVKSSYKLSREKKCNINLFLGDAYINTGKLDEGFELLKSVEKESKNKDMILFALDKLSVRPLLLASADRQQINDSIKYATEGIKIIKNDARYKDYKGSFLLSRGELTLFHDYKYQKVFKDINNALKYIEEAPKRTAVILFKWIFLLFNRKYNELLEELKDYLTDKDLKYIAQFFYWSIILESEGREKAKLYYDSIKRSLPSYKSLGLDIRLDISRLTTKVINNPYEISALFNYVFLFYLYINNGEDYRALKLSSIIINACPVFPYLHFYRSLLYINLGKEKLALRELKEYFRPNTSSDQKLYIDLFEQVVTWWFRLFAKEPVSFNQIIASMPSSIEFTIKYFSIKYNISLKKNLVSCAKHIDNMVNKYPEKMTENDFHNKYLTEIFKYYPGKQKTDIYEQLVADKKIIFQLRFKLAFMRYLLLNITDKDKLSSALKDSYIPISDQISEKLKEELAGQTKAHRLEKERMIQQYSHTLANTLNPNTIYEVANHLKKHAEFRKDACFLTDAYHAETLIRNQGLLLQARNTGSPAEFQQLIRGDRLSEDTKEKAIGIEEILNHAIERIVARFLNADYRKLELIRTQICARRGTTLGELKADFEENVFFNPNRSAIEWANANLSRIEYTLSPLWNSIHLRRDGYAEALLQGYFQELLFNALKYRDSEQDIWINIRFYEEEIESRTFLVCDWENPYTQNVSISTGKGLEGIQNDLEMLNDIREKDKVFTWREENGKFRVTFRFLKDIFVPYKPKTELDSELLAKQLNKEKNDEHSLD